MANEKEDLESDILSNMGVEDDHVENDENEDVLDDLENEETPPGDEEDEGDEQDRDAENDDIGNEDEDEPREPLRTDKSKGKGKETQDGKAKISLEDFEKQVFDPATRFEDRGGALFLNGRRVAKAGYERKVFERWRSVAGRERNVARTLATRLQELADNGKILFTKYNELKDQKTAIDRLGLDPADEAVILEVAQAYKKSPLEGVKLFLTKAAMAGVDIKSLGVAGASFDPNVIVNDLKKHIGETLKPVIDRTAAETDAEKVRKQAEGFFERNPEAVEFAESLPGKGQELGQILAEAQKLDPAKTIDDLWKTLHYELLKKGVKFGNGVTTVVTDKRREKPRREKEQQRERPRRQPNTYNGNESFADIGKDVLAMIQSATQ